MWANAQRDGRPAEYRWCPLFNATKAEELLHCMLLLPLSLLCLLILSTRVQRSRTVLLDSPSAGSGYRADDCNSIMQMLHCLCTAV